MMLIKRLRKKMKKNQLEVQLMRLKVRRLQQVRRPLQVKRAL